MPRRPSRYEERGEAFPHLSPLTSTRRLRAATSTCSSGRLLPYRKVDSLKHRPRRVAHLHVPGAGPVRGYGLLAPGAPGRATHGQLDVAHLGIPVEPDVVDRGRGGRAGDLGPQHHLAHVHRKRGPRVLRHPLENGPRDDRLRDADAHGRRGSRCGGWCRGLGCVLRGETLREEQGQRRDVDVLHEDSPLGSGCCTTRRRRSSSQPPTSVASRLPVAVPTVWNRPWYSSCRPWHFAENSGPTRRLQDCFWVSQNPWPAATPSTSGSAASSRWRSRILMAPSSSRGIHS